MPGPLNAQQNAPVEIGKTDLGGVVTGPGGPEAGVWVIAETTDLPTKFARIMVTDYRGRYVIPDLPTANYSVWVRGYGLVDSPQTDWLKQMKNIGCIGCHQLGQESTRTIPAQFGPFESGRDAWTRRIQSGQSGEQMINQLAGNFGGAPFKYLGEWTDRIAKGDLPKAKPPRPQGVERNIVITSWEWHTEKQYLHDLIASDRRNPTVNANGPLYGSPEYNTDVMPILDPKTMKYTFINTCFETHHPQFGYDANDTLWLSGTGPVAGWVNTKMFEETGDAAKSQGWSSLTE